MMKSPFYFIFAIGLFSILGLPACQNRSLDGTWSGYELDKPKDYWTFVFSGDRLEIKGKNPGKWYKITFIKKEKKNPQRCELKIDDCYRHDIIGLTSQGIYKIEKGKLTLVVNEPGETKAPSSFDFTLNSRVFILARK
jgi:uncharacterized protein (TIGR03067 family)